MDCCELNLAWSIGVKDKVRKEKVDKKRVGKRLLLAGMSNQI